ncbi:HyaD/HybD family hydrogenase maturation endopeptidase [Vibrio algicola]|uniref:HyaD/HybD family hydrogenase maturation endopeptidase n=1 Tax=Vibrio algicola TaxID=2662262 RepID=A0A5Q0TL65_9VIBR|nr:HyaD/HybD family hydrogenase maturation endopeptidase [Vibrio algicola]
MAALLLGVGNLLLTDEAIGVEVIRAFEQHYHTPDALEVVDGGTAGMELLDFLIDKDVVIIVDAVKHKAVPGTVILLEDDAIPALFTQKISPHQLGLGDLLSSLIMLDRYPKKLYLVGAIPQSIEPHIGMTETLLGKVDPMLAHVVDLLTQHGFDLQKKAQIDDKSSSCV